MICAKNKTNWEKGESLDAWVVKSGLTEEVVSDRAYLCCHCEIAPLEEKACLRRWHMCYISV